MKCPICKGSGKVKNPRKRESDRRQEATIILLKKGYGIREIQRLVGFKSPYSVSQIKKLCKN